MGMVKDIFGKKTRPTLMQDLITAKDWIAAALNSSGYSADFSFGSLKEVDRFFDEQSGPGGLLSENRGQRLFAIGAYIGEVIRAAAGGEWITDDNDPQGELNVSVRLGDGSVIWPVQRAVKRYQNGAEDGIYAYAFALAGQVR